MLQAFGKGAEEHHGVYAVVLVEILARGTQLFYSLLFV